MKRAYLMFWCIAVALIAYVLLEFYGTRNAPPYKKFESAWAEDVTALEKSPKLPKPWFDVGEVEIIGGTPESKTWLRQIHIPNFKKKDGGGHKLEVLVVPWTEEGKTGVMIQYNLVDLKTKNMIYELGRTLILSEPEKKEKDPLKALWQEFSK